MNTDVQDEWKATSYKEFELSYDLETTTLTVNVTDAAGTSILDADWSGVTFDNRYLSQLKTGISQAMLDSQQWSLPTGSFTYGSLLDAKEHPDKHRDLIVRVGGYSDYFCNLGRSLQDAIIVRTLFE